MSADVRLLLASLAGVPEGCGSADALPRFGYTAGPGAGVHHWRAPRVDRRGAQPHAPGAVNPPGSSGPADQRIRQAAPPIRCPLAAARRTRHDQGTEEIKTAASKQEGLTGGLPRLCPRADVALRTIAVALVIAGALIGFGEPTSIALVAVGLLLIVVEHTLKHLPRRPVH